MNDVHPKRPGFLYGTFDFFTAGLFFLVWMPLSLQKEIEEAIGKKHQPYWIAYLIGIPTLFFYTLYWMAKVCEDTKKKAEELGLKSHTSFWQMIFWNTVGMVILIGPAVATHGFFKTLDEIEEKQRGR